MSRFRSRTLPRLTRRRVLMAAATVGVGAAAASVAGISSAQQTGAARVGPLVLSLRDAASGTFDLFAGSSRYEIKDADLAAKLVATVTKR